MCRPKFYTILIGAVQDKWLVRNHRFSSRLIRLTMADSIADWYRAYLSTIRGSPIGAESIDLFILK